MVNLSAALVLSIIAIILSVIAIRRQRIPTKYELERRIREKFQQTSPDLTFTVGNIEYTIVSITVKPKDGWENRVKEYVYGEIPAETSVAVTTNGILPDSLDGVGDITVVSAKGSNLALTLRMDTTDPSDIYSRLMRAMHDELPEHIKVPPP